MKSNKSNFITVVIKKPSSSFVIGLIKELELNTNKKLLDNIEKIIPVSRILKYEDYSKLASVSYVYDERKDEVKIRLVLQ